MLGVRVGIEVKTDKEGRNRERILEVKICLSRVVEVYINNNLESKLEELR